MWCKIHSLVLNDTSIIVGLPENIFSISQAIEDFLRVTSEGESIVLIQIRFEKKRKTPAAEVFF